MATSNTTSADEGANTSPLVELSHRVHAVAARLAGMEAALRIFKDADSCDGPLGDALILLACSCERMNDELCLVADQMTEGVAA
ncbi:MAG: hypothetical protein IPH41_01895 [Sulfuritalea sp.]|jgi:hypothetical protein|nr:hypothetical protein [Sulfuritalea sp.]